MLHFSKKLPRSGDQEYFNEKRPVNVDSTVVNLALPALQASLNATVVGVHHGLRK